MVSAVRVQEHGSAEVPVMHTRTLAPGGHIAGVASAGKAHGRALSPKTLPSGCPAPMGGAARMEAPLLVSSHF